MLTHDDDNGAEQRKLTAGSTTTLESRLAASYEVKRTFPTASNSAPGYLLKRNGSYVHAAFYAKAHRSANTMKLKAQVTSSRTMWYRDRIRIMDYYSIFKNRTPAHASTQMNLKNAKQRPDTNEYVLHYSLHINFKNRQK